MIVINILLFGSFTGEKDRVQRFFEKASLSEYSTPLTMFVNTRFKVMASEADVALMGGEPRYKSYVLAAKKAGCKTALWGCEAAWIRSVRTTLELFDLIFARDKEAYVALREEGFPEVALCPPETDRPAAPPPAPVKTEPPEPEPAEPSEISEPELSEPPSEPLETASEPLEPSDSEPEPSEPIEPDLSEPYEAASVPLEPFEPSVGTSEPKPEPEVSEPPYETSEPEPSEFIEPDLSELSEPVSVPLEQFEPEPEPLEPEPSELTEPEPDLSEPSEPERYEPDLSEPGPEVSETSGPPEPGLFDEPEFELIVDIPPDEDISFVKPVTPPPPPPPRLPRENKTVLPFGIAPVSAVYGAANRNENIRSTSAAGGVFSLLCEDTLRRGGAVFGAKYNEKFETVHAKAERIPECVPMRGIKYAQSRTLGVYEQAASCLQNGVPVFFTGTACQIDELYAYLVWLPAEYTPGAGDAKNLSEHPRLLTADVACAGVAEPEVFSAYLKYLRDKLGSPLTAVDMSSKPGGWGKAAVRVGAESGNYEIPAYRDPFIRAYKAGLCLKQECYDCLHHKEGRRKSDMTLGCFFDGQAHIPELYDDKGASLIFVHTEKGKRAVEALEGRALLCELPPDVPHSAANAPPMPEKRGQFFSDFTKMPFDKAVSRSLGPALFCILNHRRKILTPVWLRKLRVFI